MRPDSKHENSERMANAPAFGGPNWELYNGGGGGRRPVRHLDESNGVHQGRKLGQSVEIAQRLEPARLLLLLLAFAFLCLALFVQILILKDLACDLLDAARYFFRDAFDPGHGSVPSRALCE